MSIVVGTNNDPIGRANLGVKQLVVGDDALVLNGHEMMSED
jgi:hypothetical protein